MVLLFSFFAFFHFSPSKLVQVASPNGKITFQFQLQAGTPTYWVDLEGKPVIAPSSLGWALRDMDLDNSWRIQKVKYQSQSAVYDLYVGKTSHVEERYEAATIAMQSTRPPYLKVNLTVCVFNDGVAFRYEFPKQKKIQSFELLEEHSSFRFANNPTVFTLYREGYNSSHEGLYTKVELEAIPQDQLLDMPTLFQCSDSLFVAITEAALRDFAGMYLKKGKDGTLKCQLSPRQGQTLVKVRADFPHRSPWRVVQIGKHVGCLIESNILTNLNEPCTIKDLTWLQPGKTDWTWWHGDAIKAVDFPVGQNFRTHQYYIDFCAANRIEYHAIIEHGNQSWYKTDGEGFDPPPPNADVTQPVEGLEMELLAAYSREKGVGLRLWVHWKPLSEKLEEAFALYEKWNVKGLMVDFMDRDDQEMVQWQEKVLQTAAKYHLHIQFHGAYKPTGMHRTYPNELTREGVLNLENLKWSNECDPAHNLMIPFTRMLAGATDYHSGGFRSVPRAEYEAKFIAPHVLGTRCHHLALFVVFENYLQMVADYPTAYLEQAGFEFLQQVPTVWDETRFLTGEVGNFIAIARRKGKDWYVGAMTNWTARSLEISLDFLDKGAYEATLYEDTPDADQFPNQLNKKAFFIDATTILKLNLAAGGGAAMWIRAAK